jgi:DNA-binding XRE family transcriptional regulator
MAKVVVLKNGEFQPEASIDKLLVALRDFKNEMAGVLGVRKETVNKAEREVADNPVTIDPEKKAELIDITGYFRSGYMADKKISNKGRAEKADVAALEKIYVDYMRQNPKQKAGVAATFIAVKYSTDHPDLDPIDSSYVTRMADKRNWNNLVNVPADADVEEPATA